MRLAPLATGTMSTNLMIEKAKRVTASQTNSKSTDFDKISVPGCYVCTTHASPHHTLSAVYTNGTGSDSEYDEVADE